MAKRKQIANSAQQTDYCVYIGPTIRGIIQYGDIFKCGLFAAREAAATAIEKYPSVKNLIIPGEKLAEKRILIEKPGNYLNECRAKLLKEMTGRKG